MGDAADNTYRHNSGGPLKGYRTLGKSLDSTKKKKRKEEIQARRHLEIPSFSPNEDNCPFRATSIEMELLR
jgi:hypothetical protein